MNVYREYKINKVIGQMERNIADKCLKYDKLCINIHPIWIIRDMYDLFSSFCDFSFLSESELLNMQCNGYYGKNAYELYNRFFEKFRIEIDGKIYKAKQDGFLIWFIEIVD